MRTVYPVGTTLYGPQKCYNGYTILWGGLGVHLVDMNGREMNGWTLQTDTTEAKVQRARLLENGRLLVERGHMMATDGVIEEYNWDSELVWQYFPENQIPHEEYLGPHHDVFRKENGNTLVICRYAVPEETLQKVHNPLWQGQTIYGDTVLEVDRDGEVVWQWMSHEHLDINHYRITASPEWFAGPYNSTICDWTHVNTVRALPENRHFDDGDERFRPGNVMISPRNLDTSYLIDRESGNVVWEYSGDYFGGLSGQHEPYMIAKELPGAGNVLVFDNGASPWKDLGHAGRSYVLEIDPVRKKVEWVYENGEQFHSSYTSSAERLPNGNTMICESAGRRVFEVTPACEIVWEYVQGSSRAYRYAYDHCPQTEALGEMREVPVTPPEDLHIEPDLPLE